MTDVKCACGAEIDYPNIGQCRRCYTRDWRKRHGFDSGSGGSPEYVIRQLRASVERLKADRALCVNIHENIRRSREIAEIESQIADIVAKTSDRVTE